MTTTFTPHLRLPIPDFRSSPWSQQIQDALTMLDEAFYNSLTAAGIEPWTNGVVFTVGRIVFDTDLNTFWIASVSHTTAATGTFEAERNAHPTYWTGLSFGITPRGLWLNNTAYGYYDFAYDPVLGVSGICLVPYTSNASGTIRDDAANWVFIVDIPSLGVTPAVSVSYDPTTSGIGEDNVQDAIDVVAAALTTEVTNRGNAVTAEAATRLAADNAAKQKSARNRILNSAMMVSQQNGTTAGTTQAGYYPVDEFAYAGLHDGTISVQQVAAPTPGGSPNRIRATVTGVDVSIGAAQFARILYNIEGFRVADFLFGTANAKDLVLAFGVKAPAGTYPVVIRNVDASRCCVFEYTISGPNANTDQRIVIPIPKDTAGTWFSNNGIGLSVLWGFAAGSNFSTATIGSWQSANKITTANCINFLGTNGNVFELFDVDLYPDLVGGGASRVYEVPDFVKELDLCKRYYQQKTMDIGFGAAGTGDYVKIPVSISPMRASPTITTVTAGTDTNIGGAAPTPVSTSEVVMTIIAAAAGNCERIGTVYALNSRL